MVRADMVEATEFPHLVQKYNVFGVPKTVVNDEVEFEVNEGPKGLQAVNVQRV